MEENNNSENLCNVMLGTLFAWIYGLGVISFLSLITQPFLSQTSRCPHPDRYCSVISDGPHWHHNKTWRLTTTLNHQKRHTATVARVKSTARGSCSWSCVLFCQISTACQSNGREEIAEWEIRSPVAWRWEQPQKALLSHVFRVSWHLDEVRNVWCSIYS